MKKRLGELLVARGLVTQDVIEAALRLQVGGNRRLGHILITMGVLGGDQLLEVLSEQLGMPIVDVAGEFSGAEKRTIPRYLCRKYGVLPLSREANNVLRLAMMNPMDDEAIADIERYSGCAVKPELARQSAIDAAISKYIPFSANDLFNPQVFGWAAKAMTAVALVLAIVIGGLALRYWHVERYGTVTRTQELVVFKNYDLMVEIESAGQIALRGRGAHAPGFYSVSFPAVTGLRQFLATKEEHFSEEERKWLDWVLRRVEKSGGGSGMLARLP
ncbi:MAG: hypothetical protein AB1568_13855 [Thermodesulfobacteriota bacterium]